MKAILQGQQKKIPLVSNHNLLINWDFRNPVNRNGKTEYIGSNIYNIDCWKNSAGDSSKTEILDNGIKFTNTAQSNMFRQDINNPTRFIGETLTLSFLAESENGVSSYIRAVKSDGTYTENTTRQYITEKGISSVYITIPEDIVTIYLGIVCNGVGSSAICYAAKLELGDTQTLAYQDENGEWQLIDPPDYDIQYALCSQYSPTTGEWCGYAFSNPNLLDNWYFADPINQRGQTEYTGNIYSIDRWKLNRANLSVSSDGIRLHWDGVNGTAGNLIQYVERTRFTVGQPYTFSALIEDDFLTGTFIMDTYSGSLKELLNTNMIFGLTYLKVHSTSGNIQINIYTDRTEGVLIKAVKLEQGAVQTLAHQDADGNWVLNDPPPNKVLELAKCQRYYQIGDLRYFRHDESHYLFSPYADIYLIPMRIAPAFTVSNFRNLYNVPIENITIQNIFINSNAIIPTIEILEGESLPPTISLSYTADANL